MARVTLLIRTASSVAAAAPYLLECKGAENCQDVLKGHFRTLQFLLCLAPTDHKNLGENPPGERILKDATATAALALVAFSYEKGKAAL